jgi:hypothetical protein
MIQYDTMRFEVAREWEMYLEMAMKWGQLYRINHDIFRLP